MICAASATVCRRCARRTIALTTDGLFHFRQRYALEIGESVVNALRADFFARMQRQPMKFFNQVKLGRIISRVTSDVEAVRVGIQDVAFADTCAEAMVKK